MRVISWNCKGAFHRKLGCAAELRPDILVVPECEKLAALPQPIEGPAIRSYKWVGSNARKGLAVLSFGDYVLDLHPSYRPEHEWIVPLSVSGPATFVLFAVWTVPLGRQGGRYVRPLLEALETYRPLFGASETVWAGDFNSSFVFDTPRRAYKFRDFVSRLADLGLRSVYHQHRGCDHGEEPEETFYLYHHQDKGYHIDYVFASVGFHSSRLDVSVGTHADWSKRSDHAPLVCDLTLQPISRYPSATSRENQRDA